MTIAATLTKIAAIQAAIAGVARAYDGNELPDSVEDFPAFVNIVAEAEDARLVEEPNGGQEDNYSVTMLLLLTTGDLAEANSRAIALIPAVRAAFWLQVKLGGLVQWCRIDRFRVTYITYAGTTYAGVRFVLQVQEKYAVTRAAG